MSELRKIFETLNVVLKEEDKKTLSEDPKIKELLDKYHNLNTQIKTLESEIKKIEPEYKTLSTEIYLILMKLEDSRLDTDEYIAKIDRKAYTKDTSKYKEMWELALTKVNEATKNILTGIQEALKSTVLVKGSISVVKKQMSEVTCIDEKINSLSSIWDFLKDKFKYWKNQLSVIDKANENLRILTK